jgi:hypothetical protein
MNCAPLHITGDCGDAYALERLPDMFVAKTGNRGGTVENKDTIFPDPGDDVDFFNGAGETEAFSLPTGNCVYRSAAPSGTFPTPLSTRPAIEPSASQQDTAGLSEPDASE